MHISNYQIFGMPLVGSDMCGFIGNTTEELCLRWMQLGAFYPFTRNHNDIHANSQEPYLWNRVAIATRNAVRQKYSILRYYYTKLFEVSLNGGTLVHPLFFDFPNDEQAYKTKEETFMIGPALMVAPVLRQNANEVNPYLSNENWFDLFSGKRLMTYDPYSIQGKVITLSDDMQFVNVLMRGGNIIPFQDALGNRARRTKILDFLPIKMIVALGNEGNANGNMIIDSQAAINPITQKTYINIEIAFTMQNKTLTVSTNGSLQEHFNFERFTELTFYGAEKLMLLV